MHSLILRTCMPFRSCIVFTTHDDESKYNWGIEIGEEEGKAARLGSNGWVAALG